MNLSGVLGLGVILSLKDFQIITVKIITEATIGLDL